MANLCSFLMKVRGNKEDILQFYKALTQDGKIWMGRGAGADLEFEGEDLATLTGTCKWSIQSALIDNAISMRTDSRSWYFGEGLSSKDFEFVTLYEACERWSLVMEVYAEECGCQFQEHFVCDKGEVLCDDCVNWEEYFVEDYETKEEAEEDLEITITDEEWATGLEEGRFTRGGFESWDFEI
jgi:hypothetical protein